MPRSSIAAACLVALYASSAHAGTPLVDLDIDALDPQACEGGGCWTNHLRVTDLDGDGDLDILLANYNDFFSGADDPEPLVVYANDGSGNFTNVSASAVGNYLGNLRMVAVGDVDGDGSVDIYGPDGAGGAHVLFINDGNGNFTDEAGARLPGGDFPAGGAARMGDVDNDGDLDIFAADAYAGAGPPFGRLYLNDGLGVFTEAVGAIPGAISGSDIDDVELLDVDGDFDLDIMANAHNGGIGALWLNDGSGSFAAGGSLAPPGNPGNHYNAAPCDVDGDGDLDLWIDNIGGGYTEQLQINDGNGNFTDETGARVTGNPGADDNGVMCADVDNDGDLDGVVVALGNPERLLQNDGTGNFTYVAGAFPTPADCSLWGEFGDLNGDDRLDLVMGQGECSSSDEVYFGNASMPVDTMAPVIRGVEELSGVQADDAPPLRFAVSDRTVTDEGPRLNRAWVVVDPDGAATEIDATFMGGDLFRVVLPAAGDVVSVTIRACAEDEAGNSGCSSDVVYDIGEDTTGTGTTGPDDTGTGGSSGVTGPTGGDPDTGPGVSTGVDGSGSASASASASVSASASDTGDDSGTDGGASDGGDGGCGCTTTPRGPSAAWMLLLALGVVGRRRRG
jgi:MYXO-CTERM domain-containing protein